jgi:NH3-dependent NAD+ synthetase
MILTMLIAGAAYVGSAMLTFNSLRTCQHRPVRNGAVLGISGMIASAVVLGNVLERLLP